MLSPFEFIDEFFKPPMLWLPPLFCPPPLLFLFRIWKWKFYTLKKSLKTYILQVWFFYLSRSTGILGFLWHFLKLGAVLRSIKVSLRISPFSCNRKLITEWVVFPHFKIDQTKTKNRSSLNIKSNTVEYWANNLQNELGFPIAQGFKPCSIS